MKSDIRYFYSIEELLRIAGTEDEFCEIPERFMKIDIAFRTKCKKRDCLFAKLPTPNCVHLVSKDMDALNLCPTHAKKYRSNSKTNKINPQKSSTNTLENKIPKTNLPTIDDPSIATGASTKSANDKPQNDKNAEPNLTTTPDNISTEKKKAFDQFIQKLKQRKETEGKGEIVSHLPSCEQNIDTPAFIQSQKITKIQDESAIINIHPTNLSSKIRSERIHIIDPNCPIHSNRVTNPALMFTPTSVEKRLSQKIPLKPSTDVSRNSIHYVPLKDNNSINESVRLRCQNPHFHPNFINDARKNPALSAQEYIVDRSRIHDMEYNANVYSNGGASSIKDKDPRIEMILRKLGRKEGAHDLARLYNLHPHSNDFSNNCLSFTPEQIDGSCPLPVYKSYGYN